MQERAHGRVYVEMNFPGESCVLTHICPRERETDISFHIQVCLDCLELWLLVCETLAKHSGKEGWAVYLRQWKNGKVAEVAAPHGQRAQDTFSQGLDKKLLLQRLTKGSSGKSLLKRASHRVRVPFHEMAEGMSWETKVKMILAWRLKEKELHLKELGIPDRTSTSFLSVERGSIPRSSIDWEGRDQHGYLAVGFEGKQASGAQTLKCEWNAEFSSWEWPVHVC